MSDEPVAAGWANRASLYRVFAATLLVALLLSLLGGCGWPRVHKVIVQQGNVITQEMIDKLKPGMTRSQVAYVMGEPVVRNTFNDARWDYVYTLENPGRYEVSSQMSLFFENNRLAYFVGNLAPSSVKETDVAAADAIPTILPATEEGQRSPGLDNVYGPGGALGTGGAVGREGALGRVSAEAREEIREAEEQAREEAKARDRATESADGEATENDNGE